MPGGNLDPKDEFYLTEELAEWVALKKSQYLSKLIENSIPGEIGVEEYHKYEYYIPETIQESDRTLERIEDDQKIRTYIKSFMERGGFHQVVIAAIFSDQKSGNDVFVPILVFVSRGPELVQALCEGHVTNKQNLS